MSEIELKTCASCHTTKPFSEFSICKKGSTRPYAYCKSCVRIKSVEYLRRRRTKDPIAYKESEWRRHIKMRFNLSFEDYCEIYDRQGCACAICGSYDEIHLAVDHCHKTGKVRGLLCRSCNAALGAFRDSVDVLENAIRYLENDDGENAFYGVLAGTDIT